MARTMRTPSIIARQPLSTVRIAYAVLAVEKGTDWIERCRILQKGKEGLPILDEKIEVPLLL